MANDINIKDLRILYDQMGETTLSVEEMISDTALSAEDREGLRKQFAMFNSQDTEEIAKMKLWYAHNLTRKGLPVIFSRYELEDILKKLLGKTANQIEMMERGNKAIYNEHKIPKKNNGERTLLEPHGHLKKAHRWILNEILNEYRYLPPVMGFVRDKSIKNNAGVHQKSSVILSFDIEDFFPSIGSRKVHGVFQKIGYLFDVAQMLTNLCVCEGKLPQGAPTSPAISNIVCENLDTQLGKLARKYNFRYTRYADDMTFSSKTLSLQRNKSDVTLIGKFSELVKDIVESEGFRLAEHKSKRMHAHLRQRVTGLVVNKKVNVPREKYRWLRAVIHNCQTKGVSSQMESYFSKHGREVDIRASLYGYAHFIKFINPMLGKKLLNELEQVDWDT